MIVATATKPGCSVRYMPPVSARALPREQNERLRALLREIIAKDFEGGLTKAAETLKVSHATLSDVLSGKRGVGQKLLNALADFRAAEIGLEAPSPPDWIPGFFRAVLRETGGDYDSMPRDLARAARFRVHVVSLGPAGAAASTATDLWVPRSSDRWELRGLMLHELLHGVLARRGEDRCEADVWMATAAWVVRAMLHPSGRGLILYPQWLIESAPKLFWQGH